MQILNAIIVDDEIHGRNNLHHLLKDYCPEINVIGKASSAADAKRLIYDLNPDVLFLDINMPNISGFELLESLTERNFLLVFVTGHKEYGIQAVKANAVDYLLKPVSIKELQQTVKKLMEIKTNSNQQKKKESNHDKIIISHFKGFTILDVNDIMWLEADDNYTKIHLNEKKLVTASKTLKEFENILLNESFVRVHRSEIINLKYLKEYSYEDGAAILEDGTKITVSKSKLQELMDKVKEYSLPNK